MTSFEIKKRDIPTEFRFIIHNDSFGSDLTMGYIVNLKEIYELKQILDEFLEKNI